MLAYLFHPFYLLLASCAQPTFYLSAVAKQNLRLLASLHRSKHLWCLKRCKLSMLAYIHKQALA
jgi:hypothetical protein